MLVVAGVADPRQIFSAICVAEDAAAGVEGGVVAAGGQMIEAGAYRSGEHAEWGEGDGEAAGDLHGGVLDRAVSGQGTATPCVAFASLP